jgi:hypothetical protein
VNELATILKWSIVGTRLFEGIVSMINAAIDHETGKISDAEKTQMISNIDTQIKEAIENENALFSDTDSGKG